MQFHLCYLKLRTIYCNRRDRIKSMLVYIEKSSLALRTMNPNRLAPVARFSEFLISSGFLQRVVKDGQSCFTYGPAGSLLRKNIEDLWWRKMVTKTESSFPVIGNYNEFHMAYHSILQFVNKTLPFSIALISSQETKDKSLIPENIQEYIDTSMQTNLQILHFCSQAVVHQTFDEITNTRLKWWKQYAGNSPRFTKADAGNVDGKLCFELKYEFPWGLETIESIVNKEDLVSQEIQENTQSSCLLSSSGGEYLPQCIESTMSVDTAMMVYLDDGIVEKPSIHDENVMKQGIKTLFSQQALVLAIYHNVLRASRQLDKSVMCRYFSIADPFGNTEILQLHPALAPFKVVVTQHGTKQRQLNEVAVYISRKLRSAGIQTLYFKDTKSEVNQQISRNDSIGVPFTVIVTDLTLQTGAIELRNRDTTIHETLAIDKLEEYVLQHLKFEG